MSNPVILVRKTFVLLLLVGQVLLFGCAGPKTIQDTEKTFYPEPPELPRVQYLRSFSGSRDVIEEESALDSFLSGGSLGGTRLKKPYGVAMHDGKVYVADTLSTVQVFDLKNKTFHRLEGAKGLGKLVQPTNIMIDKEGTKFVADPVRNQVVMYDSKDFYVKAFSSPVPWRPTDMASFDEKLYVSDAENKEIVVFDIASGNLLKKIGRTAKDPLEDLGFPTNITIDHEGFLYVTDVGRFQIVKYDRDGHYRSSIGKAGSNPGTFARPRGTAVDREGRIYAVDAAFNNVQIFRADDGQLLSFFAGLGNKPGSLELAAGITIDYDHVDLFKDDIDPNFEAEYLIIVVSQMGPNLVNVYAFGKEKGRKYPNRDELQKEQEEKAKRFFETQDKLK